MCPPWEARVRLHTVVKPQPRLEHLLGDSQTPALLDTGEPITADQARQLACEAAIIPTVLGGKSKTDIAHGRILCPRHHSYAHSPKYEMKTIPNGRVVFSRT